MVDAALFKKVLEPGVRGRAKAEVKAVMRVADRRERMRPDFLIVGVQKAGTSSLFAYLASYPRVDAPLTKEIRYFSRDYRRGMAWYERNFPVRSTRDRLTGEATPFYTVYPRALDRIALDLPQVKIVMILRDPLARLVSHYRHSVRLGDETLSLTEALDRETDRLAPDWADLAEDPFAPAYNLQRFSYLHRSLYAAQVERVQQLFPDRSLFLRLEDIADAGALRPVTDFVGLPFRAEVPWLTQNANPGETPAFRAMVPSRIVDQLEEDAGRTAQLLGWDPWPLT